MLYLVPNWGLITRSLSRTLTATVCRHSSEAYGRAMTMEPPPIPNSKVELHVHLDGAIRPETAFELAVQRNLKLPAENVQKMKELIHEKSQGNLVKFLQTFSYFLPSVSGNEEAIERMAYEFCEDCKENGTVYAEVRYSPHFLASTIQHEFCEAGDVSPHCVVKRVNRGLQRGCHDFGVKVNSILCCMRTAPEWSEEILALAKEFMSEGVVGIDLAGDERFANPSHETHIKVFQEAAKIGLCRTVHAGENGGPGNVAEAVDKLCAQRVGHGYHTLDDPALYARCAQMGIHFEQCPYSSYCTGSVKGDPKAHPILRFLADGINFSINTDDPMVTTKSLIEEYEFVRDKMGFTWEQMVKANLDAAKASFLPEKEKKNLVNQLEEDYRRQALSGDKVTFGLE